MTQYRDRYFEDWTIGEVVETGTYEMTAEGIDAFASQFDPQPFHVDVEAAEASIYGGIIASGWHTGSVMMYLLTSLLGKASMGSPGVDELRWRVPVRAGDLLRLRVTVLDARPSSSKPDRGLVVFDESLVNQRDEVVMSLVAKLFMQRSGR